MSRQQRAVERLHELAREATFSDSESSLSSSATLTQDEGPPEPRVRRATFATVDEEESDLTEESDNDRTARPPRDGHVDQPPPKPPKNPDTKNVRFAEDVAPAATPRTREQRRRDSSSSSSSSPPPPNRQPPRSPLSTPQRPPPTGRRHPSPAAASQRASLSQSSSSSSNNNKSQRRQWASSPLPLPPTPPPKVFVKPTRRAHHHHHHHHHHHVGDVVEKGDAPASAAVVVVPEEQKERPPSGLREMLREYEYLVDEHHRLLKIVATRNRVEVETARQLDIDLSQFQNEIAQLETYRADLLTRQPRRRYHHR